MINWTKLHDNYWILTYKKRVYRIESLEKLVVYSLAFGIKMSEIEYTLLELNKRNHNYAEFGVFKGFIYSCAKNKSQLYN